MAELSRVSRDGNLIIVKIDGKYYQHAVALTAGASAQINADMSGSSIKAFDSLSSATSSGSWRRPTAEEKSRITFLAPKPTKKSGRTFRVPSSVQASLSTALEAGKFDTPNDRKIASLIASGKPVPEVCIQWLKSKSEEAKEFSNTYGGETTAAWVEKFKETKTLTAAGFAPQEGFDYYGVGDDEENPQNVTSLLIVGDDETLYTWADGALFPLPDTLEDYEAPSIIEISDEDATEFANWLDDPANAGQIFVLTDIDPEERNLVELAYSEIDWEEIDRLQSLVADATGYSPAERSENATRQQRSNDGRFGGPQVPKGDTRNAALAKARLAAPLPLVLDPAARIVQYIEETGGGAPVPAEEPVVASAHVKCEKCNKYALKGQTLCASHGGLPNSVDLDAVIAAAQAAVDGPETPVETEAETPTTTPLYFAIVDPVDNTAVLDVISVTNEDGQAAAWKRSGAEWVAAPELLADLQGSTPPPVVELEQDELVKDVLSQVDSYDSENEDIVNEQTITASAFELADYSKEQRENSARKGLALPDGSYPIRNVSDLKNAVQAYGRAPESKRAEVRRHIEKRAKALNRKDLIPSDWKEASIFDDGHLTPLYGEFGEVVAMVAAAPGVGNAERLRQYWAHGEGAAKIRWGTEGDLSRCNRQLSKYMPGRAWGYCQNLHQRIFGMSNAKRDKAVGQ